eukprot:scaffold480947_cov51-Prasinocladus_malaysianus.AAC.1
MATKSRHYDSDSNDVTCTDIIRAYKNNDNGSAKRNNVPGPESGPSNHTEAELPESPRGNQSGMERRDVTAPEAGATGDGSGPNSLDQPHTNVEPEHLEAVALPGSPMEVAIADEVVEVTEDTADPELSDKGGPDGMDEAQAHPEPVSGDAAVLSSDPRDVAMDDEPNNPEDSPGPKPGQQRGEEPQTPKHDGRAGILCHATPRTPEGIDDTLEEGILDMEETPALDTAPGGTGLRRSESSDMLESPFVTGPVSRGQNEMVEGSKVWCNPYIVVNVSPIHLID